MNGVYEKHIQPFPSPIQDRTFRRWVEHESKFAVLAGGVCPA